MSSTARNYRYSLTPLPSLSSLTSLKGLTPQESNDVLKYEANVIYQHLLSQTPQYKAMETLLASLGLPTGCTFELPCNASLEILKAKGYRAIMDLLHFFPLEARALYEKHGPIAMELDPILKQTIFRMECRNLAYHQWLTWKKLDPEHAPATFVEYVELFLICGEMKVAVTPHGSLGLPWDNNAKKRIAKTSVQGKHWVATETALLTTQLSVLAQVCQLYKFDVTILLAGSGTNGSRLKELKTAMMLLPQDECSVYVVPTVATRHPVCLLATKKLGIWPLPMSERCKVGDAYYNTLVAVGIDGITRLSGEDFEDIIDHQMVDVDVSFV